MADRGRRPARRTLSPPAPDADDGPALAATAAALGLTLPPAAEAGLLGYLQLLRRWNALYNLTSVDAADFVVRHLGDSLAAWQPLRRRLQEHASAHAPRLLDAGSGAGLPGVVLAIVEPGWTVRCVDTVAKKAAFIRHVAASLGLPNLQAAHLRLAADAVVPPGQQVDVVVSRAFASLPLLAELSAPWLRRGGWWMAMKSQPPSAEEVAALPPARRMFHVEPLNVPGADQRCLVWLRRPAEGAIDADLASHP